MLEIPSPSETAIAWMRMLCLMALGGSPQLPIKSGVG